MSHALTTLLVALLAFSSSLASAQESPTTAGLPIVPDPKITPGDVLPVTPADICVPGYAKKVRDVPASVKRQAYALYGVTKGGPGDFEVDHLIPLSLGGSNSIRNLWPESFRTMPLNAAVKDRLEVRLHSLVCKGQLDLTLAQRAIAENWPAAYAEYVGPLPPGSEEQLAHAGRRLPPLSRRAGVPAAPAPSSSSNPGAIGGPAALPAPAKLADAPSARVWVNTRSGKFWRPGGAFYGKTKQGRYLSEADALAAGYKPAGGTGR